MSPTVSAQLVYMSPKHVKKSAESYARSRQRLWQLKRQALGCCMTCGRPKEPERVGRRRCTACSLADQLGREMRLARLEYRLEGINQVNCAHRT